ncbi:MAG TPA: hypothetical protein VME43_31715, partial [Bryobacteraceae bacterium]|nr:hypothetical protein [Bryobacteraceae bacterium]
MNEVNSAGDAPFHNPWLAPGSQTSLTSIFFLSPYFPFLSATHSLSPCYASNQEDIFILPDSPKSLSEKQLAANRRNAQRSTGPRTAEGKARAALNARKHGFRAEAFTVIRVEDLQAVAELTAAAMACYRPVNTQE